MCTALGHKRKKTDGSFVRSCRYRDRTCGFCDDSRDTDAFVIIGFDRGHEYAHRACFRRNEHERRTRIANVFGAFGRIFHGVPRFVYEYFRDGKLVSANRQGHTFYRGRHAVLRRQPQPSIKTVIFWRSI